MFTSPHTLILMLALFGNLGISRGLQAAQVRAEFAMDQPIAVQPNGQRSPAIAFNGTNFLVAWSDDRNATTTGLDIYAVRVSVDGVVLDGTAIPITRAANDQGQPAIAVLGGQYLVVWIDWRNAATTGSDIYGARVSSAGVVLDPNGIEISRTANGQFSPAASANGSAYFVVWEDFRAGSGSRDIYGARVTAAGGLVDVNGIAISTAISEQVYPAIACNGTNFLVAWMDLRNFGSSLDVYGARVTSTGTVVDPVGIPVATGPTLQEYPSIAFNKTNYFVVWQEGSDIFGRRVTTTGTTGAAVRISPTAGTENRPAVAPRGGDYLVVWESGTNPSLNIDGARVTGADSVVDTAGFVINASSSAEYTSKVAAGLPDQLLVVCESLRNGTNRIVGNYLLFNPVIKRISPSGANMVLTWEADIGQVYRVQYNSDLNTANWSNLDGDVTATNATANKTDDSASSAQQRYYRVLQTQ